MIPLCRRSQCVLARHAGKSFLSTSDTSQLPKPLFIWLGADNNLSSEGGKEGAGKPYVPNRLLLPVPSSTLRTASTPDDVIELVNQHYATDTQFVGGMGESDPGVYFANTLHSPLDTLDFSSMIRDSIELVKQERHGVPFGLVTTGIRNIATDKDESMELGEIGMDTIQVSLFAGSPKEFCFATGIEQPSRFGQVCGFIADATEQGVSVEVGVLRAYAGQARDLALSLGAIQVHVYDD